MAYDFDGTNDYIEATSAAMTSGPITLAAWVNLDVTNVAQRVVSITSTTGNDRWSLLVGATAVVSMQVGGSGTFATRSTTATVSASTWHHVAGTWNNTAGQPFAAYLDGATNGATNSNRTPTAGNLNRTYLGTTYVSSALAQYLNGRIAEAAIWNAVLSDAEIVSLAKGYRPSLVQPEKLLYYAPIVREVADYSGGLSLTTSGAVVAVHPRRIA